MLKEESFIIWIQISLVKKKNTDITFPYENCLDCKDLSYLTAICKLGWKMDEFWQYKDIFQSFTKYSGLSHSDSIIQSTFVYTIDLMHE